MVYSCLVALITIVLSDTIKCQPWSFFVRLKFLPTASYIAKTLRDSQLVQKWLPLEGSQAETAVWVSRVSFILDQTIKKAAWNTRQQCSFCLLRPLPNRLYNNGSSSRCALGDMLFLQLLLQHLLRERCPYSEAVFVSPLHCYCCHHDGEIVQHDCINAKTNYTVCTSTSKKEAW